MELILCAENGRELRRLDYSSADFELGGENDFEVTLPLAFWQDDLAFGRRIFEPGTENGGIIGGVKTDTSAQAVTLTGYVWRGYLARRIIEPPAGQAYRSVSGDLNAVIRSVIDGMYDGVITGAAEDCGITTSSFSFDRYVSVLDGLNKLLASENCRLQISYVQGENGGIGHAEVSAVPIADYSDQIELSQDSRVNFTLTKTNNTVNHLICLGSGELADRTVLHLYLDPNGKIGKTQYYTGVEEITETYENTNSEDLETDAVKHFEELIASTDFSMDVESLGIDVQLGDIVGGRDYITGVSMKKALAKKITTVAEGKKTVQYELEGNE